MPDLIPFGFARFCSQHEFDGSAGQFERIFEITDESQTVTKHRITTPKKDLVILPSSNEDKIANHRQFEIVNAGKQIDPVFLLSQRAGWNQTSADLNALVAQTHSLNLLAVYHMNGQMAPLGSGLVVDSEATVAWISMLLVHPELRSQGIGMSLLKECMVTARLQLGKQVIGLDATPMGQPLYERMGFRPSFRIWRSLLSTPDDTKVLEYTVESLREVMDCGSLLRATKAEQKLASLTNLHKIYHAGSWVVKSKGDILGLVLSRPGRKHPFIGPLLALEPGIAACLLSHALQFWRRQGAAECFLDIPENHFATASVWDNGQCTGLPERFELTSSVRPVRILTRMYEHTSSTPLTLIPNNISKQYQAQLEASSSATRDHIQAEKSVLPYLFSGAGPEFG